MTAPSFSLRIDRAMKSMRWGRSLAMAMLRAKGIFA